MFPPFTQTLANGTEINCGYGFLFSPPSERIYTKNYLCTVNLKLLFTEWFAIAVAFAAYYIFICKNKNQSLSTGSRQLNEKKESREEASQSNSNEPKPNYSHTTNRLELIIFFAKISAGLLFLVFFGGWLDGINLFAQLFESPVRFANNGMSLMSYAAKALGATAPIFILIGLPMAIYSKLNKKPFKSGVVIISSVLITFLLNFSTSNKNEEDPLRLFDPKTAVPYEENESKNLDWLNRNSTPVR